MYVAQRSIREDGQGWFAIALDGVEVRTDLPTEGEAQMAADRACFERAVGMDLPSGEVDFFNGEALFPLVEQVAHAFFRTDEVQKSLAKGMDLLRQGSEGRWWLDGQTIKVGPASGKATKAYQVRETCTCKDVYVRAARHGGMCKHLALRVLLILAQMGVAKLRHLLDAMDEAERRIILVPEQGQQRDDSEILALIVAALDAGDEARAEALAKGAADADALRAFIEDYRLCAIEAAA